MSKTPPAPSSPADASGPRTGLPALRAAPDAQAGASAKSTSAPFVAQVFGQSGQRRGLKGGPPVLSEAKSAYLETQWSGPGDRRARTGRITKTEI